MKLKDSCVLLLGLVGFIILSKALLNESPRLDPIRWVPIRGIQSKANEVSPSLKSQQGTSGIEATAGDDNWGPLQNWIAVFPLEKLSRVEYLDLIGQIRSLGGEPVIKVDRNSVTGEMRLVKIKKSVEGIKDFEAQFNVTKQSGEPEFQRLSFSVDGSRVDIQELSQVLSRRFPSLQSSAFNDGQNVIWDFPSHFSFWIHKVSAKDIENDPNFESNDLGRVQLTYEFLAHHHHDQ